MHPNRVYAWTDPGEMLAFIEHVSFSTILFSGKGRLRVVHVPVTVEDPTRLRFHLSRANEAAPHLDGASVLLSCLGPDAYVSPDWYGTPDQVPTWNYVAVECEGVGREVGHEALVAQLDRLSEVHEAKLAPKRPWTRAKMAPGRFEAMTKAIACFEIRISALRGTRKLGQPKSSEERENMLAGMEGAGEARLAELTRQEFATR